MLKSKKGGVSKELQMTLLTTLDADRGNQLYVAVTASYLAFVRACCKYRFIHKINVKNEKRENACNTCNMDLIYLFDLFYRLLPKLLYTVGVYK